MTTEPEKLCRKGHAATREAKFCPRCGVEFDQLSATPRIRESPLPFEEPLATQPSSSLPELHADAETEHERAVGEDPRSLQESAAQPYIPTPEDSGNIPAAEPNRFAVPWVPASPGELDTKVVPLVLPQDLSTHFTPTNAVSEQVNPDGPSSRARLSPRVFGVAALVLLLVAVGASVIAARQNVVAGQWQRDDQQAIAQGRTLTNHLAGDNAAVKSLDSHVSQLESQLSSLQSQLSTVATAKEKAIDQTVVLSELVTAAGSVSNQLSTCVNNMDQLVTEISNDVTSNSYDAFLEANATAADDQCSTAQQENGQFQSILSNGG